METEVDVDFVVDLARAAGRLVREKFYSVDKRVASKLSSSDLLTETDVAVEGMLRTSIAVTFPHHKFLCEESAKSQDKIEDDPTWVIDPVDGTMNFVHSLPFVAVSIGFSRNKQIVVGVVYNPILDEMFAAAKGKGATLNGKKISVAPPRHLGEALLSTGFCCSWIRRVDTSDNLESMAKSQLLELRDIVEQNTILMLRKCRDLRRLGASAVELAYIAMGRLDGAFEMINKEWDLAAGGLILTEAGGVITNFDGTMPIDLHGRAFIAASSLPLANEISAVVRRPAWDIAEAESRLI